MNEYPVTEGDMVYHVKDQDLVGVVTHVDRNLPHPTTCNVLWEGTEDDDIQWTNKLVRIDC